MLNYNGNIYFNSTPYNITLWDETDNEPVSVASDGIISATVEEKLVYLDDNGVEFVTSEFKPTDEGLDLITELNTKYDNIIIIGSIIAAQAYPGNVVSMVPCKGYERVPPEQKRMSLVKFTVFK